MIPKIIHYCWFGRNPLPKLAEKCIKSWKKYCPDYEIIRWDEDNYDLSAVPLYVRQAYEAKKWAFVTDYVRLQVVYEHGGIYMDTDVELIKPLDNLLQYSAYFGFEDGTYVNTGLGFGAEKGTPILREMMADYQDIPFLQENGDFDKTTCPVRNTEVFVRHGLAQNGQKQLLDGNVLILPTEYLCPIDLYSYKMNKTVNTYSIHRFTASWKSKEEKKRFDKMRRKRKFYLFATGIIGEKAYKRIKCILKRKSDSEE